MATHVNEIQKKNEGIFSIGGEDSDGTRKKVIDDSTAGKTLLTPPHQLISEGYQRLCGACSIGILFIGRENKTQTKKRTYGKSCIGSGKYSCYAD